MRKLAVLFLTLLLCILTVPAMAGEEDPTEKGLLSEGDNIWISISPMESHPMFVDRPAPVIPTIPGYPIRVAVYSNPYRYLTTDEDGVAIWAEIYDPNAPNFSVSDLAPFMNSNKIELRVPGDTTGATYSTVHTESDYKYQFVFYVRDISALDSSVDRLFFVAVNEDETIEYQGSGLVKVTETSQSGGGGGKPTNTGSGGGKPTNTGSSNSGTHGGSGGSGRGR